MRKSDAIENFCGCLLWKDTPILDCHIIARQVVKWKMYEENYKYFPLQLKDDPSYAGLTDFVGDRILPRTRQNLAEVLALGGIQEYSWDAIIAKNWGLCTDDCYWFRPASCDLKYDDIKIRD